MKEGTVLVRGKRVPAWRDKEGHVYRDVLCPHRRRLKLTECGKKVAATWKSNP